jgi:hypothetical protein
LESIENVLHLNYSFRKQFPIDGRLIPASRLDFLERHCDQFFLFLCGEIASEGALFDVGRLGIITTSMLVDRINHDGFTWVTHVSKQQQISMFFIYQRSGTLKRVISGGLRVL